MGRGRIGRAGLGEDALAIEAVGASRSLGSFACAGKSRSLFGRIRLAIAGADHFRRDTAQDRTRRKGLGDHRSGCHHRLLGDIRQDDRSRTDPAIATDGDLLELSWLISNEAIEAGKSMRVRTAWDLNARPDQHVILNIDPSNMAIVTDIDMFSEAGGRLGDQRSKGDLSRWMAVSQSEAIESAADQGANVAWQHRERLT